MTKRTLIILLPILSDNKQNWYTKYYFILKLLVHKKIFYILI